jgi:hypothetical protein
MAENETKDMNTEEFVLQSMVSSIGSRHAASELLQKVAECCSWGGYPQSVTPRQVGFAIARAMINCPTGRIHENLAELIRGYTDFSKKFD